MKLFIVRHGEKEKDSFDANLTSHGEFQIKQMSNMLNFFNFDKVYSSSNPRSIQTGEIISHNTKTSLEVVKALKEFPREIFFQQESDWNMDNKKLMDDLRTFLNKIISENKNVVLAMHAGINRAILSILLNISLSKTIHFSQDLGCLNLLELKEIYGSKKWCVKLLNSTYHLK